MKYNYTEDQRNAITTDASCFLLLGSAGTGKTHVLVERINYLVRDKKLDPKEILVLTSSINDQVNIVKQLDELLDSSSVTIYTLELFALKIILDVEGYHKKFITSDQINHLKEKITKEILKTPRQYKDYINNPKIYPNYTIRIENELRNYFNTYKVFEDQDFVSYASKLLNNDPLLKETYKEMYSYIFIDNAQDYIEDDKVFINQLLNASQHHFVLGNDDQMIHDKGLKETLLYDINKDPNFEKK